MTATNDFTIRHNSSGEEARLASRLARMLDEAGTLSSDVEVRLRFAREQAVRRARSERRAASEAVPLGTTIGLFGAGGWRPRAATLLPLLALIAGLILIEQRHRDDQIGAAVEIDSALLADEAPIAAYGDAGFVEFLKSPAN